MRLHPTGRRKIICRRNLQEKFVSAESAPPQAEQESIFRTFFAVQGRFGASISTFRPANLLKAMTKKGNYLFEGKKCTHRQNPGYAYECNVT